MDTRSQIRADPSYREVVKTIIGQVIEIKLGHGHDQQSIEAADTIYQKIFGLEKPANPMFAAAIADMNEDLFPDCATIYPTSPLDPMEEFTPALPSDHSLPFEEFSRESVEPASDPSTLLSSLSSDSVSPTLKQCRELVAIQNKYVEAVTTIANDFMTILKDKSYMSDRKRRALNFAAQRLQIRNGERERRAREQRLFISRQGVMSDRRDAMEGIHATPEPRPLTMHQRLKRKLDEAMAACGGRANENAGASRGSYFRSPLEYCEAFGDGEDVGDEEGVEEESLFDTDENAVQRFDYRESEERGVEPPYRQRNGGYPTSPKGSSSSAATETAAGKKKRSLPLWSTAILHDWLKQNEQNPYPTDVDKKELVKCTGLTLAQVNNWFVNARKRKLPKR